MNTLHVKKGDTVKVLSGKDKGKTGKVLATSPAEGKVIVDGLHIIKKHLKPRRQGQQGGIVKAEGAMYADKVQLVCDKCNKGVRTGTEIRDGKKVRVCKKCGKEV